MVTFNYQAKADTLLGYLSEHGYSDHYVSLFRNECERIVDYFSEFGTLEGYLQAYGKKPGTVLLPYRERVARVILCYFENGRKPSRQHPMRRKEIGYEMLSDANRGFVDSYLAIGSSGWSPSTAKKTSRVVSSFLLHCQQSGNTLSDLTEDAVWSYFYDPDRDVVLRGVYSSSVIRRFLRWAGGQSGGAGYAHILPMVPRMKQPHKVFDCLTAEEDSRLVGYVLGDGCELSLRDRAVLVVARFCGLRACDIASLRMEDVDLEHSRLSVRQHKTGVPMEQALRPVVGNAICRYVMEERPESGLPEVFLVDEREVRPLRPGLVGDICDKAYRLAGVRENGHRHGSHLLRHRFAQALVENGASDSTAMRLLGHVSPSSLNVYLETDERRLRECALSISDFAIGKEVLA
jgi:site-specific recombinase XerD